MIVAAFRVMLLTLWRDRAALVMAFVLPTVIFCVFAAIFSGAVGERIRIQVGLLDQARTATTARLVTALQADPALRTTLLDGDPVAAVRRGEVDVALVLRGDLAAGSSVTDAPILVVESPARALATPIALGQVQRVLNEALPDVVLSRVVADVERTGKIGPDERAFLDRAFAESREKREAFSFAALIARTSTAEGGDGQAGAMPASPIMPAPSPRCSCCSPPCRAPSPSSRSASPASPTASPPHPAACRWWCSENSCSWYSRAPRKAR